MLDIIINKIKELDKDHLVIAIDGKAASGGPCHGRCRTGRSGILSEKVFLGYGCRPHHSGLEKRRIF